VALAENDPLPHASAVMVGVVTIGGFTFSERLQVCPPKLIEKTAAPEEIGVPVIE
jgi:hypothetical protein